MALLLFNQMFDTAVKKLVKSVGSDIYLPSPSIASSENLFPLALVERKASMWWLGSNRYYTTEFSLENVVGDDPNYKVTVKPDEDFVGYNKTSIIKVNGKLDATFRTVFDAELDNVESINVKADLGELSISEVDSQSLMEALQGRKLDMNHGLIKELQAKKRRALCVVIGVVKTTKPTSITADLDMKVKASTKVSPISKVIGAEGKARVKADSDKKLDLPAGTVLAYQVAELSISDEGYCQMMVSHDAVGGFHADIDQVDAPSELALGVDKDLLKQTFAGFSKLSSDDRQVLVTALLSVCCDRTDLVQLAKVLKLPDTTSDTDTVQSVLDLISKFRDNEEVMMSLQNLCRALKNLDNESLYSLAGVPTKSIQPLLEVLEKTWEGNIMDLKSNSVFAADNIEAMFFILTGCDYTIDGDGLHPPAKRASLLRNAYIAVCGLQACL